MDFDALIEIKQTYSSDFDAEIDIYQTERWPFVSIKYPDGLGLAEGHDVSGVFAPLTPWFVASGVAVDGKTIDRTIWNFGDLSPVVNGVPSGNDEYAADHTYSTSGIYIANFRAIDSNGLVGSDSIKIHLASGVPMPDITLSANPMYGDAPLSVDFSYTIANIPAGVTITSSVLFFGNGKSTINPDITYVYTEPGEYIPILVVLDSRGFITCDSLKIGVNN
jgi:PKD repeat protein